MDLNLYVEAKKKKKKIKSRFLESVTQSVCESTQLSPVEESSTSHMLPNQLGVG